MKKKAEGVFTCDRHNFFSAVAPEIDYRPTCPQCDAELKEVLADVEGDFKEKLGVSSACKHEWAGNVNPYEPNKPLTPGQMLICVKCGAITSAPKEHQGDES